MEKPESKIKNRPTVEEKIHYFRKMKENSDTGNFQVNLEELKMFAVGQGDDKDREQWYYDWKQENFKELLDRLKKEKII